jgi:hypothetical protein
MLPEDDWREDEEDYVNMGPLLIGLSLLAILIYFMA